ncbi:hypothetical protein M405DRAFT_565401 [Rhizopogon salebrosus TDB-379]|nr:hypothetical protein M405DRAFT_565401 [Rhizopogon salebrosus TDB-379]
MKLFKNEDGRDVVGDDADQSALSSARECGSDFPHLHAQMAAHNTAAKTRTPDFLVPPRAQTTVRPSSPAPEHSPPSLRTPPPSSSPVPPRPAPRPVPRPAQENSHRRPRTPPPTSSPTHNIHPPHPASPPAQAASKADGQASSSELTSSEEEEEPMPKLKQRAPAKRMSKSKAVEIRSERSVTAHFLSSPPEVPSPLFPFPCSYSCSERAASRSSERIIFLLPLI